MKICSKCEMIVLGDEVIKCPDCGESFSDYRKMIKI